MNPPLLPAVVVAAVDASEGADASIAAHIVDVAATWSASFGGRLVIMSACSPPPIPSMGPLDPGNIAIITMQDMLRASVNRAEALLLQLADRARSRGVDTRTVVITEPGNLPDLIAHAAVREIGGEQQGLLVLATHTRRGLARKLLGSVAEKTAHLAMVPVLLLPPPPEG